MNVNQTADASSVLVMVQIRDGPIQSSHYQCRVLLSSRITLEVVKDSGSQHCQKGAEVGRAVYPFTPVWRPLHTWSLNVRFYL